MEVRNLFFKKVPRRKVFGKSEKLFSKRFSEREVLRKGVFRGKVFPLNRKSFWRFGTFFKKVLRREIFGDEVGDMENQLRREIVEVCHRMYRRGWICATEGNVSVRLSGGRILITPSGVCKGEVSAAELICLDASGEKISGWGEPSSETNLHLEVYRLREDVRAVIHAHPPTAIAFTIAGRSLAGCVIPEIVMTMGSIPTASYSTPGTGEAALVIGEHIQDFDAILLDRHGSLTVGSTLQQAYFHLERLEHAAKITLMAHQLGRVQTLPPAEVEKIRHLRERFGIRVGGSSSGVVGCNGCGICPESS
ncbi:MAG: class II aldolase/adducin family protein [Planctomycetota bacterium]|nr:MAG: class II aldolase/adducin family protein [Planctomycetota bacterium]